VRIMTMEGKEAHLSCNICDGGRRDAGHAVDARVARSRSLGLFLHRAWGGKHMLVRLRVLADHVDIVLAGLTDTRRGL
jgi:hypothetical protein